jgi:hypothetical protein
VSTPADTSATSLGTTKKIFEVRAGGRVLRDLANAGEVFVLATEIADSDARRATMLSLDEIRAIAALAASAGVILHSALMLLDASDRGDANETRERLTALCNATRALTIKETPQ